MKSILRMFIYYITGSIILSLGIALSILSKLGAGAFDALNSNFSKLLNVSMGTAMYISILLIFIIIMILKPKKIYIIGVLLTGLIGFGVDTWSKIIPNIDSSMIMSMIYFGVSLIIIPLGVTFIIKSNLPLSPMDNLFVILVEKTKKSFGFIKTSLETSYAIIALIYGLSSNIGLGAISIGTVIITLTIGPGIEFFMKCVKDIKN